MFFYQLKKISKSTPIFHIYLIPTFFMYKKTKKKKIEKHCIEDPD